MCGDLGRPCFSCLFATKLNDDGDMSCILGVVEDWNIGAYSNFSTCDGYKSSPLDFYIPSGAASTAPSYLAPAGCQHSFSEYMDGYDLYACPVVERMAVGELFTESFCSDCDKFKISEGWGTTDLVYGLLDEYLEEG